MAISIIYRKLLTVNIFHDYFLNDARLNIPDMGSPTLIIDEFDNLNSNEKGDRLNKVKYDIHQVFDIIPTEETKRIFKSQSWIMRPQKSGFFIAAKVAGNSLFVPLRQERRLTFALQLKDNLFMNYSDLDLFAHEDNSFYHFYNDNGLILSDNPKAGNDDRIRIYPNLDTLLEKQFAASPLSSENLLITSLHDNSSSNRVMDRIPAQGADDFEFTKNIAEGWYRVEVPNQAYSEDIYLSSFHYARKTFGLIEFTINDADPVLFEEGELEQPSYTLSFANRYTRWRYFNAEDPLTVIPSIEVTNPDGELTKPLLKEGYITVFADTLEEIRLPNPSPGSLAFFGQTIYSNTYIKWNG